MKVKGKPLVSSVLTERQKRQTVDKWADWIQRQRTEAARRQGK